MDREELAINDEDHPNVINISEESNCNAFQEMMNDAINLDVRSSSIDDDITRNVVSQDDLDEILEARGCSTGIPVSVLEVPTGITESLNDAAKQLSLLCQSAIDNSVNHGCEEDDFDVNALQEEEEILPGSAQLYSASTEDRRKTLSAVPKNSSHTTAPNEPQRKRHIMISYNRSSRETCQRIYDNLVARNYKVWMDLTDMGDDILVSMARAVENSYIVLICINQQYYESDYCRLEAQYAAENRIKFIPCLMEKSFRAESWLGIIKGSNFHIDFSSPEEFDDSLTQLIRQITLIETRLSLQPRRTPTPTSTINPFSLLGTSPPQTASGTTTLSSTGNINSQDFDRIVREYKKSIKLKTPSINQLNRNQLSELIFKIRHELFNETTNVLSDSDRSDEEDGKQNNNNEYSHLLERALNQNDLLLRLVDRLTTQQSSARNFNMDGFIKIILAVMLLWALALLYQKE